MRWIIAYYPIPVLIVSIVLLIDSYWQMKDLKQMDVENWSKYKEQFIKKLYGHIRTYNFFGLLAILTLIYRYFVL